MHTITQPTSVRQELIDIAASVAEVVGQSDAAEGICVVTIPHTTAAVTLNENWDPDVQRDILLGLGRLAPDLPEFRHAEGNSAAHIMASLMGFSVTLPISGGRLVLGRWQGVYLCEFDGPRRRTVHVTIIAG